LNLLHFWNRRISKATARLQSTTLKFGRIFFVKLYTLNHEFSWKEDNSVPIGWSLRFLHSLRPLRTLRSLRSLRWLETPLNAVSCGMSGRKIGRARRREIIACNIQSVGRHAVTPKVVYYPHCYVLKSIHVRAAPNCSPKLHGAA